MRVLLLLHHARSSSRRPRHASQPLASRSRLTCETTFNREGEKIAMSASQSQSPSPRLTKEKSKYFEVPRQVARRVDLGWGKEVKKQKPSKIAPSDEQDDKPKSMGSTVMETMPPRRSKSGHNLTRIYLNQFNLTYSYGGKPYKLAQDEFARVYAEQSRYWFGVSTFAVSVFLGAYYFYDLYYYPDLILQTSMYRFGGMIPSMALACMYTFTNAYLRNHFQRDVILLFLSTMLGVAIMMYSVTTKGAHYGTFALYFATMYTLAPLPFVGSVVIGLLLAIGYLPVLYVSAGSQSVFDIDILYAELTLLASLLLYVILRYRYLHYLAIDVIEHAVLIRDRENIAKEQQRGKDILLSMVPEKLIEHIEDERSEPYGEQFDEVTVLFAELCNFSNLSNTLSSPEDVVAILNVVFTEFDKQIEGTGVYKVETVGEVYMAVAGAPNRCKDHATRAATFALKIAQSLKTIKTEIEDRYGNKIADQIDAHVGLNSGKIVAGVCGLKSKRYKLFGDTVNTASRMESTCDHGKIQLSEKTAEYLRSDNSGYKLIEKGQVEAKGKGWLTTWKLEVDQPINKSVSERDASETELKKVPRQKSKRQTVLNIDRHRDDMQMVKDHVGEKHEHLVAVDDLKWMGFGEYPTHHAPAMQ